MRRTLAAAATLLAFALCCTNFSGSASAGSTEAALQDEQAAARSNVIATLTRLPLTFEENRGQALGSVAYLARGLGYQVQLAPTEIIVSVLGHVPTEQPKSTSLQQLRVRFQGANSRAEVQGLEHQQATSNYLIGQDPSQHITSVGHFAKVKVLELYPGIDVVYYGKNGELEFDLVIKPGANPDQVKLDFDGPAKAEQNEDGTLVLRTDAGSVRLHTPTVYQDFPEGRRRVDAGFVLTSGVAQLKATEFDPNYALVVDPIISYSDILGGAAYSYGVSVEVDTSGQSYVAGWTQSTDFKTTSAAYDRSISSGDTDVFVAKINAAGNALLYSTFLGGRNGIEYATGLKLDASGNVYVTGRTSGSDFPTTASAYQLGIAGGGSFAAKLSSTGSALLYSTYLRNANARGITVDSAGNAVVVGDAASTFRLYFGVSAPACDQAKVSFALEEPAPRWQEVRVTPAADSPSPPVTPVVIITPSDPPKPSLGAMRQKPPDS